MLSVSVLALILKSSVTGPFLSHGGINYPRRIRALELAHVPVGKVDAPALLADKYTRHDLRHVAS